MHCVCASNGIGAGFRQTEIAHLAGANQLRHRAYGFLNRRLRVDSMLIVEINAINAETVQAGFACLLDVFRFAADPAKTWRSEEHTSELQSRFDLVCRLLLE